MRTETSDCGISILAFYSAPLGLVWFVDVRSPGRCPGLSHLAPSARRKFEGQRFGLWVSCPQGDALGYRWFGLWMSGLPRTHSLVCELTLRSFDSEMRFFMALSTRSYLARTS